METSMKDKEKLNEMYRGKDLYDPSGDPSQDVAQFDTPHMMSEGGYCMAHGGFCMAEGGPVRGPKKVEKVMGEFGKGKLNSSSGDKVKDRKQAIAIALSEAGMSNKAMGGPVGYADGGDVPGDGPIFSTKDDKNMSLPSYLATSSNEPEKSNVSMAQEVPAKTKGYDNYPITLDALQQRPAMALSATSMPSKVTPDQMDALIASLNPSTGQRVGMGATNALATLGDSIMQGVARAGPGQVQKNINEQRQNQQQNLINALRAKYENQFKGQELGQAQERIAQEMANATETARSHKANEAETEKMRQTQQEAERLAAQREGRTAEQEKAKQNIEAAAKSAELGQQSRGWFSKALGINSPEATAAQKVLQGQNAQASGPLGPTTTRNGKTYEWSPATQKYHLVQ